MHPPRLQEIAAEIDHLEATGADPARLAAGITGLLHATLARTRPPGLRVREKALAYVVRDGRLLVFTHPDHPLAGLQVPAGGIEDGEPPAEAALREVREETGVEGRVVASLGVFEYDMRPYRDEVQRCHVFHVEPEGSVPERWRGGEDGIAFECFWIPVRDGHVLAGGQGSLLGRLP
ncbi:hypothetical protein Afil01_21190 [Actinorhabdospora filicis]|uniref:Nudix hydrolase domain-containing protein n=1 Tax=Actinorhabdospora filicis TaxID=1785913 RepID=A0A9W6SK62_9ACTN|nr:NUDIX domain-containing protein [Actinorhabdospora filicis]GLZ77312.1 hypothetical protein Afil01_21190 [Actinorhabdospora filicis]